MLHNYTRAGGVWAADTDLLAAELQDLDYKSTHSMSDNGGVYALVDDMFIGGAIAGLRFELDIQAVFTAGLNVSGGTLAVSSPSFFNSPAEFLDLATFDDDAVFNDTVTFNAGVQIGNSASDELAIVSTALALSPWEFDANVTFATNVDVFGGLGVDGDVDIGGDATFANQVSVAGPFVASGNAFLGGSGQSVELSGPTELRGPLTMQGAGRIVQRQVFGVDADMTISPAVCSHVIQLSGLTATRNYTIDDSGAINGDRMRFTTYEGSFFVNVKNPGGGLLLAIKSGSGGTLRHWVDVERITGGWLVVGTGTLP